MRNTLAPHSHALKRATTANSGSTLDPWSESSLMGTMSLVPQAVDAVKGRSALLTWSFRHGRNCAFAVLAAPVADAFASFALPLCSVMSRRFSKARLSNL
jgi:hypothetical protein